MSRVWREYGVIIVLLVVAVGGYLYLTRAEEDLVDRALGHLSEHLLTLVPEGVQREETRATLAAMEEKVASGEMQPEQVERFAANVLNLASSGEPLAPDEAEMVMRLALEDPEVLPIATDGTPRTEAPAALPRPSRAEMARTVRRVERMMAFYSELQGVAPPDDAVQNVPPVRFYADRGLRAEVDERLRARIVTPVPDEDRDMVAWKESLTERLMDDSERLESEAIKMMGVVADSFHMATEMKSLAMMKRLASRGWVFNPRVESLAVSIEAEIFEQLGMALGEAAAVEVTQGRN